MQLKGWRIRTLITTSQDDRRRRKQVRYGGSNPAVARSLRFSPPPPAFPAYDAVFEAGCTSARRFVDVCCIGLSRRTG